MKNLNLINEIITAITVKNDSSNELLNNDNNINLYMFIDSISDQNLRYSYKIYNSKGFDISREVALLLDQKILKNDRLSGKGIGINRYFLLNELLKSTLKKLNIDLHFNLYSTELKQSRDMYKNNVNRIKKDNFKYISSVSL